MEYSDLTLAQKALYDESSVHHTDCGPTLVLAGGVHLERKFPHLTFASDDWKPVSRLLLRFYANRLVPQNVPRGAQPASVPRAREAQPQVRTTVQARPISDVEARIRELSGERLVAVAKANKVNTEIHPTNAGITAMRRKNALLALLRRGVAVKL